MMDHGAFKLTLVDADGKPLAASPGQIPEGCIGAVVEGPGGGFVAVPVTQAAEVVDGNLGVYGTFALAVEALRSNHRRPWTRAERRRAAGGW